MISVLVVDDSVVVRRLVASALAGAPDVQVVATAANGRIALSKIERLRPDIVTMDVEMPEMDGLTAVRELRRTGATLPVIMFSALTASGAAATLDALAAGATDYVTKPSQMDSIASAVRAVRDQLLPRIYALHARNTRTTAFRPTARPVAVPQALASAPGRTGSIDIVAVGASTGGPEALGHVLGNLPADLPVPVVVVQHMPPVFTRMFAERLDRACPLTVLEAFDGAPVRPGTVLIAPGDRHLSLQRRGTQVVAVLSDSPAENSCRPAVDVLFRSVRQIYGGSALGVMLTGMGQDGVSGSRGLRAAGADMIAQDEASSVVWGMPGGVVKAGLATATLPLMEIAPFIVSRVDASRTTRTKVVV